MVNLVVLSVWLFTISYGILEIPRFLESLIPYASTIYFRFFTLLLLFGITLSTIKLRFFYLPKTFYFFFGIYFAFIFVEMVTGLIYYGSLWVVIDALNALITIGIVVIVINFYAHITSADNLLSALYKPYVYLCVYMSLTGILSWLVIDLGMVSPGSWHLPLRFQKLDDLQLLEGRSYLYSMPFRLGLVLYNRSVEFGGFEFSRISGLAREPHLASLFIAPSIFIIPKLFANERLLRRAFYITIGLFLFLSHSTTFFLVAIVFVFLFVIRNLFISVNINLKYFLVSLTSTILYYFVDSLCCYIPDHNYDENRKYSKPTGLFKNHW